LELPARIRSALLVTALVMLPALGSAATPDDTPAQEFRDAHASAPGFSEYQSRRLQLITPKFGWLGPEALGYHPKLLKAQNTFPFRVMRLSDPQRTLTLPELVTDLRSGEFAGVHTNLVAHQEAKVKRGGPIIAVGLSLLSVGIAGFAIAASSGGFGEAGSVGIPMAVIGLSAGIPILSVGLAQHAGGSLHGKLLQETDAVEFYYDRDEVWEAVDHHNSRLRVELGLPDDSRLDAPSETDL
jgi:hypothetical protein